jgi:hypothetical protein
MLSFSSASARQSSVEAPPSALRATRVCFTVRPSTVQSPSPEVTPALRSMSR